jgi:hypothetical protein
MTASVFYASPDRYSLLTIAAWVADGFRWLRLTDWEAEPCWSCRLHRAATNRRHLRSTSSAVGRSPSQQTGTIAEFIAISITSEGETELSCGIHRGPSRVVSSVTAVIRQSRSIVLQVVTHQADQRVHPPPPPPKKALESTLRVSSVPNIYSRPPSPPRTRLIFSVAVTRPFPRTSPKVPCSTTPLQPLSERLCTRTNTCIKDPNATSPNQMLSHKIPYNDARNDSARIPHASQPIRPIPPSPYRPLHLCQPSGQVCLIPLCLIVALQRSCRG